MNTGFSFIIIDDSELDRFVTQKFLERTHTSRAIKAFHNAQHALDVIGKNPHVSELPTIILLDLQMPHMNGFDFVEEFEKLPPEVKKNYRIAVLTILSSSNDPTDVDRIQNYEAVHRLIEKPLNKEKLLSLLNQV